MTMTPDRIDNLALPERLNNALVLRAQEPHYVTMSTEEWQASMDEMEGSYRDYLTERTNLLQQQYDGFQEQLREAHRTAREEERRTRHMQDLLEMMEPYVDSRGRTEYCYCSPGRGQFFVEMERRRRRDDAMEQALQSVRFQTYLTPEPKPAPARSKELVPVAKPVLDPVEVIPQTKWSRVPALTFVSVMSIAVLAFAVNVASAFIH